MLSKSLIGRINHFQQSLSSSLSGSPLSYKDVCKIDYQGLYIISDGDTVLYVGKTNRTGKVRMQELAADFRSHTFNKKLLSKKLKDLGFVFDVLRNETKKSLIQAGYISLDDFQNHQSQVNEYIKSKLIFRFCREEDQRKLISLEHFAIAILNPVYND